MFGDNVVFAEIYAEYQKIRRKMDRTTDPVKLEQMRKDIEVLKDEYRSEIAFLCGN